MDAGTEHLDKAFFHKNGYLVIKKLLPKEEIEWYRETIINSISDSQLEYTFTNPFYIQDNYDLLAHKVLHSFVTNEKIIKAVKYLIDDDNLVYFGLSKMVASNRPNAMSSHRDNADNYNPSGKDWSCNYKIVRVGIYLQDHINTGGNIFFNPGTHKKYNSNSKSKPAFCEKGDIIIWSMRLTHSVSAIPPHWLGGYKCPYTLEKIYYRLLSLPHRGPLMLKTPRIYAHCIWRQ